MPVLVMYLCNTIRLLCSTRFTVLGIMLGRGALQLAVNTGVGEQLVWCGMDKWFLPLAS